MKMNPGGGGFSYTGPCHPPGPRPQPEPLASREPAPPARPEPPATPPHLDPASVVVFRSVADAYELEGHQVRMLVEACQALDRAEEARRAINSDLTVTTRLGELKAHPLLLIERDNRTAFARLMGQLGLRSEPRQRSDR